MTIPYPQLEVEGIKDQKVLQVIRRLLRKLLVPQEFSEKVYVNSQLIFLVNF